MSNQNDEDDKDKATAEFISSVERDGEACRSVIDGHLLIFKRTMLQKLLDENRIDDKIIIFVKRQDIN